jgi:hypothetical protein
MVDGRFILDTNDIVYNAYFANTNMYLPFVPWHEILSP